MSTPSVSDFPGLKVLQMCTRNWPTVGTLRWPQTAESEEQGRGSKEVNAEGGLPR